MIDKTILHVAQAICNSDSEHGCPGWNRLTSLEREDYIRRAKAAIEATRTPVYSRYGVQLR